jgi:putative FmdB family regulatory protein
MPLFEYRCEGCGGLNTVLEYSWSAIKRQVCEECGGSEMTKLISGFSFHQSWGDSLRWAPSGETLRDVDEDDPQDLDRFMGRLKNEMGGQVTPDFDQMRGELAEATAEPTNADL